MRKEKKKGTKKEPVKQMMKGNTQVIEEENKQQSWKPFFHLIRSVKLPWLLILACIGIQLLQSYLVLLFPEYTEKIYAGDFSQKIAITAVCVVLGQALLTACYQFVGTYTANINLLRFQKYIWKKLSKLPISYFEENEPRDLISRTTTDATDLSEFFAYSISGIISTLYSFIASFVLIYQYDWRLALSQLIAIPLSYAVGVIAGRIYFKFGNRIQGKLADMSRYFSTILPYITLVKLFGQESREEKNGFDWIEKYAKTNFDFSVTASVVSFVTTLTTVFKELIIILMGVWLVRAGDITIGVWIAFYMYANTLFNSFQGIMNCWQGIKRTQGTSARICAVTDEKEEKNEGTENAKELDGDIEFHKVSFCFGENQVLSDIDFCIKKGEVTAIVGPSGAGKTTILNLLERFYQPQSGEITYAGKKMEEIELHSWRDVLGYIPQDTKLLSGTIRDNITYGCKEAVSEERLIEVAKLADAYQFITEFEQGFDTQVGENGEKLSGGQRQRIAIARALLKDAKIFLFDEMNSNLDAESDACVEQTVRKLALDHTIIMVAHRMTSVRDADQILVMEKSTVAACGTHEELIQKNELYRHMVELQSKEIAV